MLHSLIFKSNNDSPDEELLRKQRNLIHDIDSQIAELLVKRMLVVDEIAAIKILYNIPIIQSNQWNKVVKRYRENSLPDEHYASFIEKFLELLHQQSILRQQKIKEI
jgi:chorismate mutase